MDQIIVELPGIDDPDRAVKLIGETALLEFVEGTWAPDNVDELSKDKIELLAGKGVKLDEVVYYDEEGKVEAKRKIFLGKTALTGAELKMARPGTDRYGKPMIEIEFTSEGTEKFREATAKLVGRPLAILLDGKIISAPEVREAIPSGKAQITGHFSVKEMRDLVIKLKAGALPIPIEVIYNKTVGPTLGRDSIEKSKLAGAIGITLVCVYMIANYLGAGVIAVFALGIYFLLVFAAF
ncbi:MAG: protein translocase subunit SecD, partial [Planctomycetes bacterium]|nr:protein translocase subunit SecD [Planctomycetota bacterium]